MGSAPHFWFWLKVRTSFLVRSSPMSSSVLTAAAPAWDSLALCTRANKSAQGIPGSCPRWRRTKTPELTEHSRERAKWHLFIERFLRGKNRGRTEQLLHTEAIGDSRRDWDKVTRETPSPGPGPRWGGLVLTDWGQSGLSFLPREKQGFERATS